MGRRGKGGPPRGPRPQRADVRLDRWLKGAFDAHRAGNLREAEKLARRVLGAAPDQPDALHLLATVLPGATIVHCRRDPFDNAISLCFTDFMVGHEYSNDLRAIGRQIRGMRALMAHWEAVLGRPAGPDPGLRGAGGRPGAAHPRDGGAGRARMGRHACLRPHEVARTVRTASAWQVRQPVCRRSAGRAPAYERFLDPLREGLGEPGERADDAGSPAARSPAHAEGRPRSRRGARKKTPSRGGKGFPVVVPASLRKPSAVYGALS